MALKKATETRSAAKKAKEVEEEHLNDSGDSQTTQSTCLTRQQEKEKFSSLNDRLANYIERVRSLETENARLHVEIRDVEVVERRDKSEIMKRYESKVSDIRSTLEVISREKSMLEIVHAKAIDECEELRKKVDKLQRAIAEAEDKSNRALDAVADLTARLDNAVIARKTAEDGMTTLKKELTGCKAQLNDVQNQLNSATLQKSELERKAAAYKDDLDFERQNHSSQMEEYRRKRDVEMELFSKENDDRNQAKYQLQLQAMRDVFNTRLAGSRAEGNELYKTKWTAAAEEAARLRSSAAEAKEEAALYRSKVREVEVKNAGQKAAIDDLKRRMADLENELQNARASSEIQLQDRDQRIRTLEKEVSEMLSNYQDLMDVKVQLDTELQAYQQLLEGEESRLKINVSQQSTSSNDSLPGVIQGTIRRATKRRRLDNEQIYEFNHTTDGFKSTSRADGCVVIEEVCTDGDFVRLVNNSNEEQSVGAWLIKSEAGGKEVMFKFRRRQTIQPNMTLTVWSNNALEKQNDSLLHIAMKNQEWPVADEIRVNLVNDEGDAVAWYESILKTKASDDA